MKQNIIRNIYSFFIYHVLVALSASVFFSCAGGESSPINFSWTIMFYANGDNNLENSILSDIKEMELATLPEQITIIALIDRPSVSSGRFGNWSDTKLFRIVHGSDENSLSSEEIESDELSLTIAGVEELNMCDASVLTEFIGYCKSNYPADRYALIIGSHGDGWKFPSPVSSRSIGYDETSHNMSTSIADLASALRVNPPDVIIFDACNMGNIETLYELMGCAQFIVASPNPLPLSGFNYTDVFSGLGSGLASENFALRFAASWERVNDDITMMVYSMERFSDFINHSVSGSSYIEEMSSASISNIHGSMTARNDSIRYSVDGSSDHIDVVDYCRHMVPEHNIPFDSFIFTKNSPMLSIYFPSSAAEFEANYNNTSFAIDTSWNEALESVLQ